MLQLGTKLLANEKQIYQKILWKFSEYNRQSDYTPHNYFAFCEDISMMDIRLVQHFLEVVFLRNKLSLQAFKTYLPEIVLDSSAEILFIAKLNILFIANCIVLGCISDVNQNIESLTLMLPLVISTTRLSFTLSKKLKIMGPIRYMHRATSNIPAFSCTYVTPVRRMIHLSKRGLPDQGYKAFRPKNKITGKDPKTGHNIYESDVVTSEGKELPLHEQSHVSIRDNATNIDVGLLTSQKGNAFISSTNYKGQNKAQYFRPYDTSRYSAESSNMKEDSAATEYLKKFDKEINDAVKIYSKFKRPGLYRVDKNSSKLHHEDGKPIYDKNGKEIDYD